jgi:hypothetical protein
MDLMLTIVRGIFVISLIKKEVREFTLSRGRIVVYIQCLDYSIIPISDHPHWDGIHEEEISKRLKYLL